VVSGRSGGNWLCFVCSGLLAAAGSRRPHVRRGPTVCSCAVGSCGKLGVRAPHGSWSRGLLRWPRVWRAPATSSSAVGPCGGFECNGLLWRDLWSCGSRLGDGLDGGLGPAETSCAAGSVETRCSWGGLVCGELHDGLDGGLVRGELQRWAWHSCAMNSRRDRARRRPRISAAGSALPRSGHATQMHVELRLAASRSGGVGVNNGQCWSGRCCFPVVARSDRCRRPSESGAWPLLWFAIPASVVVGSRGWWSSWQRVWWLSNSLFLGASAISVI
jgi:hypothetical protein